MLSGRFYVLENVEVCCGTRDASISGQRRTENLHYDEACRLLFVIASPLGVTKAFMCSIGKKIFVEKNFFNYHMEESHSGEIKPNCSGTGLLVLFCKLPNW
ncbi:hypothetical protein TSMEX_000718 [Taenia solium]|eukprot:TsM_001158700 transcript=TsM_001158700 gene=TsM_001158700